MSKVGGNPEVVKDYRFKAPGGRPSYTAKLSLWILPSMDEELKTLGREKNEFVRQAIADALKRRQESES